MSDSDFSPVVAVDSLPVVAERRRRLPRKRRFADTAEDVTIQIPQVDLLSPTDNCSRPADGELEVVSETGARRRDRRANRPMPAVTDVIVLDDTLPDASDSSGVIDLTSDESIAGVTDGDVAPQRRDGRASAIGNLDDDAPLVAVRTIRTPLDTDVIIVEKENQQRPVDEFNSPHDSLTPKRKMLSCPICMDHERAIRRSGRSMMSTTCGHIFCNDCITQSIATMKCCPTCRKRLTKKTGIHPIFV